MSHYQLSSAADIQVYPCSEPIVHQARYAYLKSLLGRDIQQFHPHVIKKALDGVYWITKEDAKQLKRLAEMVAERHGIVARFGPSTVFGKAVRAAKKSLRSIDE